MFTLTILFPLLSFIILAVSQGKFSKTISATIGIIGVGISTIITVYLIINFYLNKITDFVVMQVLWSWFKIENVHVMITLRLDRLSLMMLSIITVVGLIIHIYAIWYMKEQEGYSRFFAYTNLFMANMILLVLSDNLLLLYLGWEGVGLCSYLLIGFNYTNPKNGIQAFKSFIMTRFGDICLICALFIIYDQYHTLDLDKLLQLNSIQLSNNMSNCIAILILLGSMGKSAQIPLNTWLVSAMVGPTPVSALIHAATMVTSGVYLINRMHNFFLITPYILYITGIIGALTLLMGSCSALFQCNIKKILAYSTISQIGYMFLSIGSQNWIGSIFHLTTHACSKALLFLSAGSLVRLCYGEQNIFKIGCSYRINPFIYICFLIGGLSLSGLPIVTAGFYSKEFIFSHMFSIENNYFFVFFSVIGTCLTSIYIFRMIFIIFHGQKLINFHFSYTLHQYIALVILSLLSTYFGGQIQLLMFGIDIRNFYQCHQLCFILISEILVFLGIWIASLFWLNTEKNVKVYTISIVQYSSEKIIRYLIWLIHYGWGIDWIYKRVLIKPYLLVARKLSHNYDVMGIIANLFIFFSWLGKNLICIENGQLNWYVASISIGAMIMLFIIFI